MAGKGDLGSLEGDLGPPQHQSLLELSSELPDIMPLPGIGLARLRPSNDAISGINDIFYFFH